MMYPASFPDALKRVCTEISLDQDAKVQVFEMTIRALGSLLSTYQYLDKLPDTPKEQAKVISGLGRTKVDLKTYRTRLLAMALDLGERMLPAFNTKTGLPYARVNLRHGVEPGETTDTCKPIRILAVTADVRRGRSWQSRVGIQRSLTSDG